MKPDSYYKSGEDLTFTPTSHEEERELFRRAKAGDTAATETIVRNHLLLVANIARRLAKGRLPEEDVISAANYALMIALPKFDPSYPNRFSAYLKLHVRGEIARLWTNLNIVSKADFSDGVPVVSVPVEENASEDNTAEEADHRAFLSKLAEQAKSVLDPREREIVDLLFSEVPTNKSDVARKLKLSRERIGQLTEAALEKLRRETRRLMNLHGINQ